MSAQRKLISILARPTSLRISIGPRPACIPMSASRSRSISSTSTLLRPAGAEKPAESSKDDTKPVPSEQLTEEAKKAEPDAAEQVEEVRHTLHLESGLQGECR